MKVLLGVSSGIAAYKVLELIPLLQKQQIEITVMMTGHAAQMVDPEKFEERTGRKVYRDLFPKGFEYTQVLKSRVVDHIALADRTDLVVLVPATANLIGKIAHGIADDFVTTTVLACTCPVMVFPSMNVHMWHSPVVIENIWKLKQLGFIVIDPKEGRLACGYEGKGRLPDVVEIVREILAVVERPQKLKGKKIVITAGGTEEPIDDVRFITNKSSGKMGAALADVCVQYGAQVTLLKAHTAVTPARQMTIREFGSSEELFTLIKEEMPTAEILFHAAAVSDFVVKKGKGKLTSTSSHTIELTPQTKILDRIKQLYPGVLLIGFKAEFGLTNEKLVQKARERLHESSADFIIANDIARPDRGFRVDTNEVFLVSQSKVTQIPLSTKRDVARRIIHLLCETMA